MRPSLQDIQHRVQTPTTQCAQSNRYCSTAPTGIRGAATESVFGDQRWVLTGGPLHSSVLTLLISGTNTYVWTHRYAAVRRFPPNGLPAAAQPAAEEQEHEQYPRNQHMGRLDTLVEGAGIQRVFFFRFARTSLDEVLLRAR